jgi:hypothetical protein
MSTYAHYKLWAGVLLKDLPDAGRDNSFVQDILNSHEPVSHGRMLDFTGIYMHGAEVGVGVVVFDLDWATTEEGPSVVDMSDISVTAADTLKEVSEILPAYDIKVVAKLYNHLDLGG